jgi:hypothetical protein
MPDDLWKDIPEEIRPMTGGDGSTLTGIVGGVREAVALRHDFQTAAGLAAGTRRLQRTVTWESAFAKGSLGLGTAGPSTGRRWPALAELAQEHKRLERLVRSEVDTLKNAALAAFLAARIEFLFPDIGFSSSTGAALLRLRRGQQSVLDKIYPLGVAYPDLLRLLVKIVPLVKVPRQDAFYW